MTEAVKMRAEGKLGGERQTCFTSSAPNLPVDFSTGGYSKNLAK